MYAWQILPVPSNTLNGYVWKWKRKDVSGNTNRVSARGFAYYYDCVLDAKKYGFNPEAPRRMR